MSRRIRNNPPESLRRWRNALAMHRVHAASVRAAWHREFPALMGNAAKQETARCCALTASPTRPLLAQEASGASTQGRA